MLLLDILRLIRLPVLKNIELNDKLFVNTRPLPDDMLELVPILLPDIIMLLQVPNDNEILILLDMFDEFNVVHEILVSTWSLILHSVADIILILGTVPLELISHLFNVLQVNSVVIALLTILVEVPVTIERVSIKHEYIIDW